MDEMKLKLSSKFMRGLVSKLITNAIYKKFGFKPEIELNEIEAALSNGKIHFHLNVDGDIDEKSVQKIRQLIDLD